MITTVAPPPTFPHRSRGAPSPSPSPSSDAVSGDYQHPPPQKAATIHFSPPLIAMVVVVAAAFVLVTYSRLITRHLLPPVLRTIRRWRRRRRRRRLFLPSTSGDLDDDSFPSFFDSPFGTTDGFHVYSPYGLDESVIKTIPLSVYTAKNRSTIFKNEARDCAVCLLEFEEDDYIRTLPVCSHLFHVDCIDMWLRSHANCPLCRAGILRAESPFIPLMSARIRPSLDDPVLRSTTLEPNAETVHESATEITPSVEEPSPMRNSYCNVTYSEDRVNGRDILLKRSYSFGFERNLASERMVLEPATASPWRFRRSSFWSKRPSPFGSLTKPRVFSFRYYRGMKSPFFRRRGGFFPLSESSVRFGSGGGSSWRRSKSMTSPMMVRSSRLRCGDPEALLSPERFSRR